MTSNTIKCAVFGATLALGLVPSPWSPSSLGGAGVAVAQVPSSARAGSRSCSEAKSLRPQHSKEPTKITFVNKSATYRALNWIDFKGHQKSYGGMNPGESKTVSTFRTHPWVVATGPGDCIKIYLPAAEPSTVTLK